MSTSLTLPVANSGVSGPTAPLPVKCYVKVLPPELLAIVFQEVVAPNGPEPIMLDPGKKDLHVNEFDTDPPTMLSHVCRYWRDVALGTPMLWTRINGRCLEQMEVFLERSEPLTIDLVLDAEYFGGNKNGPLHAHAVSAVETHGPRLRRLDLSMVPTREHVDPLLTSLQAPQLECLTITSSCCAHGCVDTKLSWTPLLNDQASSLRALAMVPVVNWMPSCPFPNLTHLFLSLYGDTGLCHPFDILRLLSNAPALTFVHIDNLFFFMTYCGDWQPPSDPIPLQHLRSLVFTSCIYDWACSIISHLSLPEGVFIRLQVIVDVREGQPDPLPPLALRPVTSLDIATGRHQILMVADGSTSGLWFSGYHDRKADPTQYVDWIPWLRALPERLALSHVTHLHINLNYDDQFSGLWPDLLAHMPPTSRSYSEIPVTHYAPTTALSELLTQEQLLLCPVLHTLTIEWPDAMDLDVIKSYQELPKMLGTRARAGHPIRHVIMQTMFSSYFEDAESEVEAFLRDLERATEGYEAEYELVVKDEFGEGLCAYEMRGVWRVDGEEQYWEAGDAEKPHYELPPYLGGYSWTGIWI